MNYRSHTKDKIKAAIAAGQEVYQLNTDTGDDDVLVGSYGECLSDVLDHFEFNELPGNWELIKVDWEGE